MKRNILTALASGLALAVAAPASAATTVAQCQSGMPNSVNGCNINFADGMAGTLGNPNVVATSFTDVYDFQISSAGTLGVTLTSSGSSPASQITFSTVSLTAPNGTSQALIPGATGATNFFFLSNLAAVAGTYALSLTGTINSTTPSAFYTGGVSFAPSVTTAVPEPAAWGMMIVGFGLVGGALRRRKTSVAFG